jgi:translation initiation factor IF-3
VQTGEKTISTNKKQTIRVNKAITAPRVHLVDPDKKLDPAILGPGELTGVMPRARALEFAEKLGLDLVEVSPNAEPPVVRIMDYGKLLFDEKKSKKKQKISKIKEIKLRPVTEEGDYKVKIRNLLGFLESGDKVKVTIRFRGREITHKELGTNLLDRVVKDIEGVGVVEHMPKLEGRQMVMMISPKK